MSKVQDVMQALADDGFVNVEWAHTGGGCYAIRLPLGDGEGDFSEIMITGEDVFSSYDYDSDEYVNGEWFADRYNKGGDSVTDGEGVVFTRDTAELIAAINASLEKV